MGIIEPGMKIFDPKKKINAKIIGTESCNGWTYWHYNLDGSLVPIDNLRKRLISRINLT